MRIDGTVGLVAFVVMDASAPSLEVVAKKGRDNMRAKARLTEFGLPFEEWIVLHSDAEVQTVVHRALEEEREELQMTHAQAYGSAEFERDGAPASRR